ncbi:SDR family NAD(P)-dependent oxidoreductase [Acuticoccus kandeliae]|uniref:SDR family NAD(P)-dependent oxidoreductase n=1 Tax=Acuticoccus kandeliae TaxID=2073160 RepID=UPI000D3E11DF|nr:SDR family NAD(P)-dependent oxidoreductase [Acuticoccus kandeliae]
MSEFAGKTVLVTGAASGIGFAIAAAFSHAGAKVILSDVDAAAAQSAAAGLQEGGGAVTGLGLDVANTESAREVCARLADAGVEVDILVNNAGINRRGPADTEHAEDDFDAVFRVNVTGTYRLTRLLHPMLRRRQGCVVNLASIQSFIAFPNSIAYTASKGAIAQMTKAMAVEFAPSGIRVNAVAPGFVRTAMTAPTRNDGTRMASLHQRIPLGRFAEPDEIAEPVLFLCSARARYMTGAVIPVDGGFLAT